MSTNTLKKCAFCKTKIAINGSYCSATCRMSHQKHMARMSGQYNKTCSNGHTYPASKGRCKCGAQ